MTTLPCPPVYAELIHIIYNYENVICKFERKLAMKAIKYFILIICGVLLATPSCRRNDNDDDTQPTPTQTIDCSDITTETVWEDRGEGIDYLLNCVLEVRAKLVIAPGVVIQCKSDAGIVVESGGVLKAVGTTEKKIEFRGDVDAPGVWKGIYFRSNSVENELSFCLVSNGGSSSFDGVATRKANVRVANNAQLKIRNTEISKSAKDGLYVDGLDHESINPITVFSNNVFTFNQEYPISAIAPTANVLDGLSSTYTDNGKNKILLRGGRMYGTHVWKKHSIPFLIESIASVGYYNDLGNLTIEPGVRVEFADNAGLCTGDYSSGSWLKAVGTASERIVFTGATPSPGAWKGIAFQSLSPNNQLSYVEVSYGGSSSYTGATQKRANLHGGAWSAGTFTIDNATISNSAAWGIWVSYGSPDITVPSSVTYSNNASGNYYKE